MQLWRYSQTFPNQKVSFRWFSNFHDTLAMCLTLALSCTCYIAEYKFWIQLMLDSFPSLVLPLRSRLIIWQENRSRELCWVSFWRQSLNTLQNNTEMTFITWTPTVLLVLLSSICKRLWNLANISNDLVASQLIFKPFAEAPVSNVRRSVKEARRKSIIFRLMVAMKP